MLLCNRVFKANMKGVKYVYEVVAVELLYGSI
jgi:hypothetical protein